VKQGGWSRLGRRPAAVTAATATVTVLSFAALLMAVVVWQAWSSARSRARTSERVLADYAAVAAWAFRTAAHESLGHALEHILHPSHAPEDGPDGPAGASELVASHRTAGHECEPHGLPPPLAAVHFRLRDSASPAEVAGHLPSTVTADAIVRELTRRAREASGTHWPTALALLHSDAGAVALAYNVRVIEADTFVWGVALTESALDTVLRRATEAHDLLPPSLLRGVSATEIVVISVRTAADMPVWSSQPTAPAATMQAVPQLLSARWDSLRIAAAALPAAAPVLLMAEQEGIGIPAAVGLFLLTGWLLWVAVRQLADMQRIAELRTAFVASVSHELRTPLALQRIAIDALRLGRVQSPMRRERALGDLDRENARLSHLVENLLRLGRRQRSLRAPAPAATVQLSVETEVALNRFRKLIELDDAKMRSELEPGLLVAIGAEAYHSVLLNLLENAAKYGPAGQTITVRLVRRRNRAVLTVDDQGPGIRPEERLTVWDQFSRGTQPPGATIAGTGIGLTVVRDIVESHGGSVAIGAAPDGGARFEIELPLAPAAVQHTAAASGG
jgi:signal transduction histidine kinase